MSVQQAQLRACSDCHSHNRIDAAFCRQCGAVLPVPKACSNCGRQSAAKARFCHNCASPFYGLGETDTHFVDGKEKAQILVQSGYASPKAAILAQWTAEARVALLHWSAATIRFIKKRPRLAIGGAIVTCVAIIGVAILAGARDSTIAPASRDVFPASTASGVQYATRLTHIRNAPTSIGTVVLGDLQPGTTISGTWVTGPDGVTKWPKIALSNGSAGYVWGANLASYPPALAQ